MKKILKTLFLFVSGLIFLIPSVSHVAGCGSGASAPPASIPAPVSSLITVSPPDPDTNLVLVVGDVGSVEPLAVVLAANATLGGVVRRIYDLLVPNAYAQIVTSANADDQGRFFLELFANSGDEIDIRQQVDGELSDITTVMVP
jgi:hypothetical protein